MKLEFEMDKPSGEEEFFVPTCEMNLVPNIILTPKEQKLLQQMMQATWDHFLMKVVKPRLDRMGDKLKDAGKKFKFDRSIIFPEDPTATEERIAQYEEYYPIKYQILRDHLAIIGVKNPLIMEIGVRAGYSAWTFLQAAPEASYIGFDANNGTHGGQGGEDGSYMRWAKKILEPFNNPPGKVELIEIDTQIMDELSQGNEWNWKDVDFFHVDGDHTVEGVQHDLDLAYGAIKTGGLILIDDYDYLPEVKEGVDNWLKMKGNLGTDSNAGIIMNCPDGDTLKWEYRKSLRGEILIWKCEE